MRLRRGFLVLAGAIATVAIGAVVDASSHSVSDTLYGAATPVLILWLVIGLVLLLGRQRSA